MATLGQSMLRVSSKQPGEATEEIPVNPTKDDTDGYGSPTIRLGSDTDVDSDTLRRLNHHLETLAKINQFPAQPSLATSPALDVSVLGSADNQTDSTSNGQLVFADPTHSEMQTLSSAATEEAEAARQSQAFLRNGYGIDPAGAEIDSSTSAPPTARYVSRVLGSNRFSGLGDTNRLTNPQGDDRDFTIKSQVSVDQNQLGSYSGNVAEDGRHLIYPSAGKNALRNGVRADENEVQLRNVALRLMVEATGHKKAAESLARDTRNRNLRSQGRKTLLPSGVQLGGSRVDGNRLQVGAGITSTASSARKTESLGYAGEFADSGASVGTLTSPLEQFGDGLGGGLFFQALAGAVALLGVSSLFSLIKSPKKMSLAEVSPAATGLGIHRLVDTPASTDVATSSDKSNGVGRAIGQAAARIASSVMPNFNVPATTHAFDDCVAIGIKSFYGINGNGGGFASIASSPGFYASIMRTVVRDLEGVTSAARQVRNRPLQGLQDFVDELANSKTFQFLTVMAGLGEAALNAADDTFTRNASERLGNPSGMLGISTSARTGLRLLPESMLSAGIVSQLMGNSSALEGYSVAKSNPGNLTANSLGPSDVRYWESTLEAEYFPLTLHDLRTHELVSLNAFVTDIQDSFQPSYKNTSGFGRVDDVLTYEKTTRQIQLGFMMVATNPTDHGVMWDTINKIVTLVYPQWSKGRLIQKGETSFRVPFSQVITASPMIRLRFGETITGNYTRFGLLRLFGAGEATQGASVLGQAEGTTSSVQDETRDGAINSRDAFEAGSVQLVRDAARLAPFRFDGNALNDNADQSTENASDVFRTAVIRAGKVAIGKQTNGFVADDKVVLLRDLHVVVDTIENGEDRPSRFRDRIRAQRKGRLNNKTIVPAGTLCSVVGTLPGDNSPRLYKVRLADGEFVADHNSLAIDMPDIIATELDSQRIDEGDTVGTTSYDPNRFFAFQESVKAFFNANPSSGPTNPIVRSFESNMSKGLAGFITSLSFDYSDATYETAPGSRAPVTVKVSMGFTPVHDIAPGLDADGYNRAPIYQVGRVSRLLAGIDGRNSIDFRGDGSEPIVPHAEQAARTEALRQINEERQDEQDRIDRQTLGARSARDEAERRAAEAAARRAAILRQRRRVEEFNRLQVELAELEQDSYIYRDRIRNLERVASGEIQVVGGDITGASEGYIQAQEDLAENEERRRQNIARQQELAGVELPFVGD
jgi:hypothetical protein